MRDQHLPMRLAQLEKDAERARRELEREIRRNRWRIRQLEQSTSNLHGRLEALERGRR